MEFLFNVERVRKRARLPHWDVAYGITAVTFNLHDAIPRHVREQLLADAARALGAIRKARGEPTFAETLSVKQWLNHRFDEVLDGGAGCCFMRDPRVAKVVADAITFFDEQRYELFSWSVMPNHVHALLSLAEGEAIDRVIHSWKSFTAKAANRILGRTGTFWQGDYWDTTMRSAKEFADQAAYIVNNPVKAELFGWEFAASYPERIGQVLTRT